MKMALLRRVSVCAVLVAGTLQAQTQTLYLMNSSGGTITSSAGEVNNCFSFSSFDKDWCEIELPLGTEFTLFANADARSVFSGWSGDCSGTEASCVVTMNSDLSVAASFSSCPGNLEWIKSFGGPGGDRALGVADLGGSYVVVGYFSDTVSFGGTGLQSAGGFDAFVARFAGDGSYTWSVRFGGAGLDEARAVAIDSNGDVLVTGVYEGTVSFGATMLTSAGDADVFVAKLSAADGAPVWARSFGGQWDDEGNGVAADGTTVLLTGAYTGQVSFDAIVIDPSADDGGLFPISALQDLFVARLAGDGTVAWAVGGGGPFLDIGTSVASFGSSGTSEVLVGANYHAPVTLFSDALGGGGSTEALTMKLQSTGSLGWTHERATPPGEEGQTVLPLATGSITATRVDGFILERLDALGAPVWERWYNLGGSFGNGSKAFYLPPALALAPGGNLWLASIMSEVEWVADAVGPIAPTLPLGDLAVVEVDPSDGTVLQAQSYGGLGWEVPTGLAIAADGAPVVAGHFRGSFDSCEGTVIHQGQDDILLFKVSPGVAPPPVAGALMPQPVPLLPAGPGLCLPPPAPVLPLPAVNGSVSFLEVVATVPQAEIHSQLVTGDFDSDGDDDVLLTQFSAANQREELWAWTNDGAGGMTDGTNQLLAHPETTSNATDLRMVVFDADLDGKEDVFIADGYYDVPPHPGRENLLLLQEPTGLVDKGFTHLPIEYRMEFHTAAADVECDGDLDLWMTGTLDQLLLNDGTGHFSKAARWSLPPERVDWGIAFCDVDRDGDPDIVSTQGVAFNDGFGTFGAGGLTPLPPLPTPGGVLRFECADLTLDGYGDIVQLYVESGTELVLPALFLNNGDGTFTDQSSGIQPALPGWEWFDFVDLNSDGWLDVLLHDRRDFSVSSNPDVSAMLNDGDGTFTETILDSGTWIGSFARPLDADGDPHADVAVVRLDGAEGVLINQAVTEPGLLEFTASSFLNTEDGSPAVIGVSRQGGTEGAVSVAYRTTGGTTAAGIDFTPVTGRIVFMDGEGGVKTFSIPVFADAVPEGEETLIVELFEATHGAAIGSPGQAVVRIHDSVIFADGFESGDLSLWSPVGSLAVVAGAAAEGVSGLRVVVTPECLVDDLAVPGPTVSTDQLACSKITAGSVEVVSPGSVFRAGSSVELGNDFSVDSEATFTASIEPSVASLYAYVEDDGPIAESRYEASFSIRLDNLTLGPGDELEHFNGYSADGSLLFSAVLRHEAAAGKNRLALRAWDSVAGVLREHPSEFLVESGFNTIGLVFAVGFGDGELQVSINGSPPAGLSDLQNGTSRVEFIRWGAVDGNLSVTPGSLDVDDFFSSR